LDKVDHSVIYSLLRSDVTFVNDWWNLLACCLLHKHAGINQ